MDIQDVVLIEDSLPAKLSNKNSTNIKSMYYQHQNQDFPVAEQAMIWSRNTTNFINQSMSLAQRSNRTPLNSNKTIPFVNLGVQNRPFLPQNGFGGMRNFPRPPYTIYNYDPYLTSYQMNNFTSVRHQNYLYNNNFWMKVKLEETPDKGEIVSQFYIDDNQTPIKICDYKQNDSLPEFIDVNSLAKQSYNHTLINNQSALTMLPPFQTDDKNKSKKPVPLFLKRNRILHNNIKLKTIEENDNKDDNDDIIFVAEYKNNDATQSLQNKTEMVETDNKIPLELDSTKEEPKNTTPFTNKFPKFGKRKRKDRNLIPPRRNPKRQVQIHKEFMKAVDCAVLDIEKEVKLKKTVSKPIKTQKHKTKNNKRSTRVTTSNGATYNPPSPLTNNHYRDWPVDGMHERPEYDPTTGKIEPFDHTIRNISTKYNLNHEQDKHFTQNNEFRENEKEKSFPKLCHDMLHHVLAYVATVKALEKQESKPEDSSKVQFLGKLELAQNNDKIENKICDILKSIINDVFVKDETDLKFPELNDLLKQNILLYCLTNNVDKSEVAKYIASVKPEDIIKLSNEQFKLLTLQDN